MQRRHAVLNPNGFHALFNNSRKLSQIFILLLSSNCLAQNTLKPTLTEGLEMALVQGHATVAVVILSG